MLPASLCLMKQKKHDTRLIPGIHPPFSIKVIFTQPIFCTQSTVSAQRKNEAGWEVTAFAISWPVLHIHSTSVWERRSPANICPTLNALLLKYDGQVNKEGWLQGWAHLSVLFCSSNYISTVFNYCIGQSFSGSAFWCPNAILLSCASSDCT